MKLEEVNPDSSPLGMIPMLLYPYNEPFEVGILRFAQLAFREPHRNIRPRRVARPIGLPVMRQLDQFLASDPRWKRP